jgi:hypothetical protein
MKRIIALLVLALTAVIGVTVPAHAYGPNPIPQTYLSSYKFWPYATYMPLSVCVAVGDTVAPIAHMRMTIDTYSAADGQCVKLSNTYYATADSYRRWTGSPANVVGWVNRYYEGCWSTALLRQKWTAIAIGEVLGANLLSGSSYAGRGMSATSGLYGPSRNTDGVTMDDLYLGLYEGIY